METQQYKQVKGEQLFLNKNNKEMHYEINKDKANTQLYICVNIQNEVIYM